MTKTKKILRLYERRETWRIRSKIALVGVCMACQKEVSWLTGAQAAQILGISERDIFRLVETRSIHFEETQVGGLLVCPHSLGMAANGTELTRHFLS